MVRLDARYSSCFAKTRGLDGVTWENLSGPLRMEMQLCAGCSVTSAQRQLALLVGLAHYRDRLLCDLIMKSSSVCRDDINGWYVICHRVTSFQVHAPTVCVMAFVDVLLLDGIIV